MGHGQNQDLSTVDDIGEREGEPRQEQAPDAGGFSDPGPERPGHGMLGSGIDRAANLFDEVETEACQLRVIPVASLGQLGRCCGVEPNSHALPVTPAVGEPLAEG
ncbi:MAG: hypothetical protein U0229_09355 [Anaeromyxobacter sp.]